MCLPAYAMPRGKRGAALGVLLIEFSLPSAFQFCTDPQPNPLPRAGEGAKSPLPIGERAQGRVAYEVA